MLSRAALTVRVIAIFGPTGMGKTGVAIELAELLRERGEDPVAISCDALQVYEGLSVLTGVATAEEQARLEHKLVGFVPVTEPFNVGDYMPLAHAEIDAALAAGRRPIVVGGTGLYLRAALAELSLVKAPPESENSELWSPETRHPTAIFGLGMDRERLYERIDARTEAIVAGGRREEVERAEAAGAVAHRAQRARLRRGAQRRPGDGCSSAPATTPAASSPGCARSRTWRWIERDSRGDARRWRRRSVSNCQGCT